MDGNKSSLHVYYIDDVPVNNFSWKYTNKNGDSFYKLIQPCYNIKTLQYIFTFDCKKVNNSIKVQLNMLYQMYGAK